MTKKKSSAAEDIDIKIGDEIPFEDETAYKAQAEEPDVVADLRDLGQQFAATLRTAWNSEERKQFEHEMREGMQTFASEIDKAFKEVKASEPAKKVKSEAADFKAKADSGDVVQKTRSSLSQGLRWFSEEIARVADSFTPIEKEPPADDVTDAEDK
jgi:phenylalanyl-tRNA synthetase alpha subunit